MLKDEKGFTIVEVISAIAILAIISAALLQMFVVSAKINRRAYEVDKANVLAVSEAEVAKANPVSNIVTKFYDADWQEVSAPNPYVYTLETTVTHENALSIESVYHPDFLKNDSGTENTINLSSDVEITVYEDDNHKYWVKNGDATYRSSIDKCDINIAVKYVGDGAYTVTVNNQTDSDVNIYFFNTINEISEERMAYVNPVDGVVNAIYLNSKEYSTDTYDITCVVKRNVDNSEIARYSTKKYLPHE